MSKEIKCEQCGKKVVCDGFTNTCSCGADYNWNGTRLAPREQWGEETGEHPADIARAGLNPERDLESDD